ncbi:flagellin lysine-N-methylase [Clostridium faecium]
MEKGIMLIPKYVKKFKCIGDKCEDSCCIGWNVDIDKDTYNKYRNIKNKKMKEKLDKIVKRNRTKNSKFSYAKIHLEKNRCPFLNENYLCDIYINLGKEYLSNVCTTYPRSYNKINGIVEKSLTLSCPEVIRLALLNSELMEFEEIEFNEVLGDININVDTNKPLFDKPLEKYFWDLRIFTISLLQNRSYSLEERLIILGLFYQKVNELIKEKKDNYIIPTIDIYLDSISNGSYNQLLNNIPSQNFIQMNMLKKIIDKRIIKGVVNEKYIECFKECLLGLGYIEGEEIDNIPNNYIKAYEKHYKPYICNHSYILENYLVNYVFKNVFPLGNRKNVFDEYMMLIIHYAMIKMQLIGISGYYKENFSTKHVIKLIQSFAKVVEHDNNFIKEIYDLLEENNINTMAYMTILIKN